MKKLFLLSLIVLGFAFTSSAQNISENAIGLRIGDNNGLGAEISYQRALGEINRLEADLGWRSSSSYNAFQLTGIYQWVFPIEDNLNWYAGAGAGLASFNGKGIINDINETVFFVAGDVGIEYDFDFPLLLSLDLRPELGFGDFTDGINFDIALGVRYQF